MSALGAAALALVALRAAVDSDDAATISSTGLRVAAELERAQVLSDGIWYRPGRICQIAVACRDGKQLQRIWIEDALHLIGLSQLEEARAEAPTSKRQTLRCPAHAGAA